MAGIYRTFVSSLITIPESIANIIKTNSSRVHIPRDPVDGLTLPLLVAVLQILVHLFQIQELQTDGFPVLSWQDAQANWAGVWTRLHNPFLAGV